MPGGVDEYVIAGAGWLGCGMVKRPERGQRRACCSSRREAVTALPPFVPAIMSLPGDASWAETENCFVPDSGPSGSRSETGRFNPFPTLRPGVPGRGVLPTAIAVRVAAVSARAGVGWIASQRVMAGRRVQAKRQNAAHLDIAYLTPLDPPHTRKRLNRDSLDSVDA